MIDSVKCTYSDCELDPHPFEIAAASYCLWLFGHRNDYEYNASVYYLLNIAVLVNMIIKIKHDIPSSRIIAVIVLQ